MPEQKISQAEWDVMEAVWNSTDWLTANDVLERLAGEKQWKYTTVATFLTRLKDKGFLEQSKRGMTNVYRAVMSKEDYKQQETREFVASIHNGSEKSLMAALYGDKLSDRELDELIHWVETRK